MKHSQEESPKFELVRRDISVKPVVGVKVMFSLEDAKELLALTSYNAGHLAQITDNNPPRFESDSSQIDAVHQINADSRNFLRSLAKKILNIQPTEPTTNLVDFAERMFEE